MFFCLFTFDLRNGKDTPSQEHAARRNAAEKKLCTECLQDSDEISICDLGAWANTAYDIQINEPDPKQAERIREQFINKLKATGRSILENEESKGVKLSWVLSRRSSEEADTHSNE